MRFGEIPDEPIDLYHATDAVSHSKLNVFRRSAELYRQAYVAKTLPQEEPGKPLIIGSALHSYLNDGHASFARSFVVIPQDAPRRPTRMQRSAKKPSPDTLAAIAFWDAVEREADEGGKSIISAEDLRLIEQMLAAVARNAFACELLTDPATECEVTYRKKMAHFAVQCRPDARNHAGNDATEGRPYIVDIKTTPSLHDGDFATFAKSFQNFGYHRQAAFYREVYCEVMDLPAETRRPDFYFIAIEKEPPFECVVYPVSDTALAVAEREVIADLKRLRACYESNTWPRLPALGAPLELSPFYVTKSVNETAI